MKKTEKELTKSLKGLAGVHSIFLFGSQASGHARPDSDYDYCIVEQPEKDSKMSFKQKLKIMSLAGKKTDLSLFHDLPLDIRMRVFHGKLLYTQNYEYVLQLFKQTSDEYTGYKYFKKE